MIDDMPMDDIPIVDRFEAGQCRSRDQRFVMAGRRIYSGRYGTHAFMTQEAQARVHGPMEPITN